MAEREIMGLRDWRLSERHRGWGRDCPMVDLDFIVTEFDHCRPVALVEYKHCSPSGNSVVNESAGIKTIRALADMAGLPAWISFYRPWTWSFKVRPLNGAARELWGGTDEYIFATEKEYVETLYRLQNRPVPEFIKGGLNATHATLPGLSADFDALKHSASPDASCCHCGKGSSCASGSA